MRVFFLMGLLVVGPFAMASLPLSEQNLGFEWQRLLEPWESYPCSHHKSSVGEFEWDVQCQVGRELKKVSVHLVVSFYPKTTLGTAAYETLYWITDFTDSFHPKSYSTTLWTHQTDDKSRMKVLEASLGMEDDRAALKLVALMPE